MDNQIEIYKISQIENQIFTIRGVQVMFDKNLADFYQVKPIRLREQVKRNQERFPEDFMFQLTDLEVDAMVSQNAIPSKQQLGGSLPYVFTELGVAALSGVLKSERAVQVSIQIVRAFVAMRKLLINNAGLLQRIENVENKLTLNDANFERIFTALESSNITPKQDIFFNGQIYEAYSFVIKLIEKAQKSIILIDNYVDNSVLDMLAKKQNKVAVTIVTQASTPLKPIDISKFNQQYPTILLNHTKEFHDRFLVIDNQELYHIGASLKDLGKKCFAFSLIEEKQLLTNLLNKL
jgi:ORF6N domain